MRILAIDQGTTSTRALNVDDNGSTNVVFSRAHEQYYPQPNWVEHDPLEIMRNIRDAIDIAGAIDAIGIANQGESCLAWNKTNLEPLSPVLVWQDIRNEDFIQQNLTYAKTIETRAQLPFDSYFSASKLQWLMHNNEKVQKAAKAGTLAMGTTDAWFMAQLTGQAQTDASTASRTLLMNANTGDWDQELCDFFDIPIEALPPIRPSAYAFGQTKTANGFVPIYANIVDQQAALYGHHCEKAGQAKMTFGTGAFALCCTGNHAPRYAQHAPLPTLAWQIGEKKTYAMDGGVFAASAAINWAKSLGLFDDFKAIEQFDKNSAAKAGVVFVPALFGLGCPHWDREVAGAWFGLKADTNKQRMVQSVLEGVALRMAEVVDSMRERIALIEPINVDGGLSKNTYFLQYMADVTQCELLRPDEVEQTALGVARLAFMQLGIDLPPQGAGQKFSPRKDRSEERQRFAHALQQAKNYSNL